MCPISKRSSSKLFFGLSQMLVPLVASRYTKCSLYQMISETYQGLRYIMLQVRLAKEESMQTSTLRSRVWATSMHCRQEPGAHRPSSILRGVFPRRWAFSSDPKDAIQRKATEQGRLTKQDSGILASVEPHMCQHTHICGKMCSHQELTDTYPNHVPRQDPVGERWHESAAKKSHLSTLMEAAGARPLEPSRCVQTSMCINHGPCSESDFFEGQTNSQDDNHSNNGIFG